jgi:hypothetical protein
MTIKLAEMGYDFSQFTLDDLIQTLAAQRQAKLITVPMPMPRYMFGAWVKQINPSMDFIFYDQTLSPQHQVHTILHELAHWWCNHKTLVVDLTSLRHLLVKFDSGDMTVDAFWEQLTKRAGSDRDKPEEVEAEVLALLIQDEAHHHERWQELSITGASDRKLKAFLTGFGLLEE